MKPFLSKFEEKIDNKNFVFEGTTITKEIEDTDPDELMPSTILTETVEESDPDEISI